jgi:hypothetical protein
LRPGIVKVPPIVRLVPAVVTLLAKLALPVVLKPPGALIALPGWAFVKRPLLMITIEPEDVATKASLAKKSTPLKVADPKEAAALNVVVPVAALVWVKAPEIFRAPLNVMAALLVIVNVVRLVKLPLPTAPRLMTPPSALRVSVSAEPPTVPSVVPVMVKAPLPEVKTIDAASARVRLPPILKALFVVVMLLAKFAAPVVLKPPAAVIAPVAPFVNVPLLVTATLPVDVKLLFTA